MSPLNCSIQRSHSQADLWECVKDTDCPINDDSLQLAVMRDPRAVTVSSYFQLRRKKSPLLVDQHDKQALQTVDGYFIENLATVCKWVSVRYLLFAEKLADRSEVFWYNDAVDNPVDWHTRYLSFVGIRLPRDEVTGAALVAGEVGGILGFPSKGLDKYLGGEEQVAARSYRDELSQASLAGMDDVLRVWLPPAVLEILGLSPKA